MTRTLLKRIVGSTTILIHLGLLSWIFLLGIRYIDTKQVIGLVTTLLPLFGLSIYLVRKDFLDEGVDEVPQAKLRYEIVFASLTFLMFYCLALVFCMLGYPAYIQSVEDLRTYLLATQSVFGIFFGVVIDTLFYPKRKS